MFAEVAPLFGAKRIKTLTYKVPKELRYKARIGKFVAIPLGKTKIRGLVVGHTRKAPDFRLRPIYKILDLPALSKTQIKLAFWLSKYYFAPLGRCIKLFMAKPLKRKIKEKRKPKITKKLKNLPDLVFSQKKAVEKILARQLLSQPFYLYDKSGEARWRVYLHLISEFLTKNQKVLFLIPEVNLTKDLVKKFSSYFLNKILTISGNLSTGQRELILKKIKTKKSLLIIGSRASLFYPYKNLGLVIVEDEDNQTYKQDMTPRYNSRDLAVKLAELSKAKVILSSNTPSLESYFKAKNGEYTLLNIKRKVTFKRPRIQVIDLRDKKKNQLFSTSVLEKIKKSLEKNEKIIIFTLKKGFSTIACQQCGETLNCPNCEKPLTLYKSKSKLICQSCQSQTTLPKLCPNCQSYKLNYIGVGTERVESEIKNLFPKSKIFRIDKDIMKTKLDQRKIYKKIRKEKPDIIIGTKILLTSIPLPKANLIILNFPDFVLNLPDFRSSESVFSQIVKSAENLGLRKKSQVLIQTYHPKNQDILFTSKYDFENFYNKEIEERKSFSYPPFSRIIKLTYKNKSNLKGQKELERVKKRLEHLNCEFLGPSPCFISKTSGKYCWQIVLKLPIANYDLAVEKLLRDMPKSWIVDPDPISLL